MTNEVDSNPRRNFFKLLHRRGSGMAVRVRDLSRDQAGDRDDSVEEDMKQAFSQHLRPVNQAKTQDFIAGLAGLQVVPEAENEDA